MEQFIKNTSKRLTDKVTSLRYVNEDWGQVDFGFTSVSDPVKYPCVLIDIENIDYKDNGKLQQAADLQLKLRYFTERQDDMVAKNKDMWNNLRAISSALHGWSPAGSYARIQRVKMSGKKRDDNLREYQVYFSVSFVDDGATKKDTRVCNAVPVISIE